MLKKNFPLLFLLGIVFLLFFANFSPSKFLIGWDNLLPELDFILNIKRSIFSVWQESQGLGLIAGNGHAAELPRQIILYIVSFIMPLNWIRQFYTLSMLFIGSLGTYFLIKKAFLSETDDSLAKIISLTGGLFYVLNLATLQIFYVPFEPFVIHFAFLPWLIFSAVLFIKNPTRKNIAFLILINILAIPQNQVPTIFMVYFSVLSIIVLIINLGEKSKNILGNSVKLIALTLLINSFWLLPFLYFLFTNSHVALEAKINQMATETVFLQNKDFGNLSNVMVLKGFWFKNVDPNMEGNFAYMLNSWKNYISNPIIQLIGYLNFGVILIGLISSLKTRKTLNIAFASIFIFAFTMLATNTFPFSFIDSLFRQIPLFSEVFRFPFTKFANIALLTYAIFFALGIKQLSSLSLFDKNRIKSYILPIFFILTLIIFILPMFKGDLFYSKEKISIPADYTRLFKYFNSQNPNSRIANFPQYTFWGWSFYNWGYGGSGFLWYGIKQPILDRAFDVWSRNNENYYWEASQALYSKNPISFLNVLNKYQINWLIVDKNIIAPYSPKSLYTVELKDMITKLPEIKKTISIGNIDVYKVSLNSEPNNFVFTDKILPAINGYNWNDSDKVYEEYGNYISLPQKDDKSINYFFPFRSMFSGKNQENEEFDITNKEYLELKQILPESKSKVTLNIPSFSDNEHIVFSRFHIQKKPDGSSIILVNIKTPEIFINKKGSQTENKIWGTSIEKSLFTLPKNTSFPLTLNVNGISKYKIDSLSDKTLGSTFLSLDEENSIILTDKLGSREQTITKDLIDGLTNNPNEIEINKIENNSYLIARIPKIDDGYENFNKDSTSLTKAEVKNCDNFNKGPFSSSLATIDSEKMLKLTSENSTACISFYSPTLFHDQGYAIFIQSANEKGRSLHFWFLNEDAKFTPIDTYLRQSEKVTYSTFIVPPQDEFGRAYSLHFDNISIGNDKTINYLGKISLYPINYNFLKSLKLTIKESNSQEGISNAKTEVLHPNESRYYVNLAPMPEKSTKTLVLSQSFDVGWKAYYANNTFLEKLLPFFFAKEIKNHVLINNWENGWQINQTDNPNNLSIIIVYVPQYIEFIALSSALFILILLTIFTLNKKKI